MAGDLVIIRFGSHGRVRDRPASERMGPRARPPGARAPASRSLPPRHRQPTPDRRCIEAATPLRRAGAEIAGRSARDALSSRPTRRSVRPELWLEDLFVDRGCGGRMGTALMPESPAWPSHAVPSLRVDGSRLERARAALLPVARCAPAREWQVCRVGVRSWASSHLREGQGRTNGSREGLSGLHRYGSRRLKGAIELDLSAPSPKETRRPSSRTRCRPRPACPHPCDYSPPSVSPQDGRRYTLARSRALSSTATRRSMSGSAIRFLASPCHAVVRRRRGRRAQGGRSWTPVERRAGARCG